jgi:hypothetical protein
MAVQYEFIPPGSVVQPKSCRVYLDVGNVDAPLVFDHHYPGSQAHSTTSLVVDDFSRFSALADDCTDVHLITHQNPDLDAIASTWVVSAAMNKQPMDAVFLDNLATYVDAIDQGFTALSLPDCVPLYVLIGACLDPKGNEQPLATLSDAAKLHHGHAILSALHEAGSHNFASVPMTQAPDKEVWRAASKRLKVDRQLYREDLERAVVGTIRLPKIDSTDTQELIYVKVSMPQSQFFKSWARGDPSLKPGPMLMIGLSPTRVIFSVPPGIGVHLKGLGDLLELHETRDESDVGCSEEQATNRPGYNHSDPWYDGRGTAHNYTIIDSPRAGTRLSWQSLETILDEYAAGLT